MLINKRFTVLSFLPFLFFAACSQDEDNPFWSNGEQFLEIQQIFEDERFPNVVVAMDGSVIATWGRDTYQVRRSEDGGASWGPVITVADPGFHGGGVTVDENSGSIFTFIEEGHPIAPLRLFISNDHGKKWAEQEVVIHPDINGNVPSMHMNESGITLKYGKHAGRLIRPSRNYAKGNHREFWPEHYTNAIYSDDGGKTWHTSDPFPSFGTGEATIEELSDGRIYYNTRRHWAPEGENPRMRHTAWSYDGGKTWEDLTLSEDLPDGAQNRDYGLMGGLIRLPLEGYDILLFSNIESSEGRKNGTIWASFNGGKTWPVKRQIEEGSFAYSSMAAGRDGTPSEGWIYLMYEGGGDPYGYAYMARFNLAWVTNGIDWREFLEK